MSNEPATGAPSRAASAAVDPAALRKVKRLVKVLADGSSHLLDGDAEQAKMNSGALPTLLDAGWSIVDRDPIAEGVRLYLLAPPVAPKKAADLVPQAIEPIHAPPSHGDFV